MAKRLTKTEIFEQAFSLLGGAVGALLAGMVGYTNFGEFGAIVGVIFGAIFGYVGTRFGADWFHIFH